MRDHVHEAQVNEVCAAAYADDSVLTVTLTFSCGLQHREDLWVLQNIHEHKMNKSPLALKSQHNLIKIYFYKVLSVLSKNKWMKNFQKQMKQDI